jgi:hypothetical protein
MPSSAGVRNNSLGQRVANGCLFCGEKIEKGGLVVGDRLFFVTANLRAKRAGISLALSAQLSDSRLPSEHSDYVNINRRFFAKAFRQGYTASAISKEIPSHG